MKHTITWCCLCWLRINLFGGHLTALYHLRILFNVECCEWIFMWNAKNRRGKERVLFQVKSTFYSFKVLKRSRNNPKKDIWYSANNSNQFLFLKRVPLGQLPCELSCPGFKRFTSSKLHVSFRGPVSLVQLALYLGYVVKCVHFIVEFNANLKKNSYAREPVIKMLKCKMQWNWKLYQNVILNSDIICGCGYSINI
jgi:hypothetical protein